MSTALASFLGVVSTTLLDHASHPVAADGANRVARALATSPRFLDFEASHIDAVTSLSALPPHPLTTSLLDLSDSLPWIPSPRVDDGGTNVGLVLLDHCVELDGLQAGLTVVGPHSDYPEHDHPPAEVYLVLGGEAEWRFGGSTQRVTVGAGGVVHNNPHDRHIMVTNDQPTVAIWFLWEP